LVTWNRGAERLYGYTASEMLGAPVSILEQPKQFPTQSMALKKLKSGEAVPQFETVHLRKNKTPFPVCLTISAVREKSGRLIGASTLAQDESNRRQQENDQLELIRELAEALAKHEKQAP